MISIWKPLTAICVRFNVSIRVVRPSLTWNCVEKYSKAAMWSWAPLATASSERIIPLCGQALWAAEPIVASDQTSKFAFSRYNRHSTTKANSASAALNKWLKQYVPIGCTMHSFRHSMRDRLRSVQCPSDIADQIGGWTSEGVGQGYGSGYTLNVLQEWMEKALVGLD